MCKGKGMTQNSIELLSPAGDFAKLKMATLYGADAVYLGGEKYNLRQAAGNFHVKEMKEAIAFAHVHGTKVFVVVNNFFHDEDFEDFPSYLKQLEELKVDALIASDLGVIAAIKEHSELEIHLSTQASCLNISAARFWKEQGVKRIVLGREVSISEAARIKKEVGVEVEMFVHGSMCMAYSGNCTISNFTSGRDSNRGGCAHSCRFEYSLDFGDKQEKSFFMSSKDLCGIELLPAYLDAGIDSLKIEGRMKSYHYVAGVTKAYAEAISYYQKKGSFEGAPFSSWVKDLEKINHREYTQASLLKKAGVSSIYHDRDHEICDYQPVGHVVEVIPGKNILVEVRANICESDELEFLPFHGECMPLDPSKMQSLSGENVVKVSSSSLVSFPYVKGARVHNILRKRVAHEAR